MKPKLREISGSLTSLAERDATLLWADSIMISTSKSLSLLYRGGNR
jgi:hypothetical protein